MNRKRWFVLFIPALAQAHWLVWVVVLAGALAALMVANAVYSTINQLAPDLQRRLVEESNILVFVNANMKRATNATCLITNSGVICKALSSVVLMEKSTDCGRTWAFYENLSDRLGVAAIFMSDPAFAVAEMDLTDDPVVFYRILVCPAPDRPIIFEP